MQDLDPRCRASVKQHALDMGVCPDRQISPAAYRLDKGNIGRAASTFADRVLHEPHAVMDGAVHVLALGMAQTCHGGDEVMAGSGSDHGIADPERAILPAPAVLASLEMLHGAEMRQHVVIAPSRIAQIAPAVEVVAISADENHAIDRTGATQGPAARPVHATSSQAVNRLRVIVPVQELVETEFG